MGFFCRFLKNFFVVMGVFFTLGVLLLGFQGMRFLKRQSRDVEALSLQPDEDVYLTHKLSGSVRDSSSEESALRTLIDQLSGSPASMYLSDFQDEIDLLIDDDRVRGLVLDLSDLSGSLAQFSEIRRVLTKFRESGKKLAVWISQGDLKSYYLASAATNTYLAPVGGLSVTTPGFEHIYFGEALRKLGVDVEVVRSGKYKSAFETFVANKPSDATLEMYGSIAASLEEFLVTEIAEGRSDAGVTRNQVATWLKRGLYTPEESIKEGMIDAVAYFDEATDLMVAKAVGDSEQKKNGTDAEAKMTQEAAAEMKMKPRVVSYARYFASVRSKPAIAALARFEGREGQGPGIALIEARGEIHLNGIGEEMALTPASIGPELEWALKEEAVKGVVLRISSPGGSATAADLIWKQVSELAKKKPLVVSMETVAASGGYYIAAPAKMIFAEATTITGSIGVIGIVPNFSGFGEKYGINFYTFSKSDRARLLDPGTAMSAEDKELLSRSIDHVYQNFVERVALGRSMSVEEVDQLAQGRIWSGAQANEINLVDRIGGLEEAIAEAWVLAGFSEDDDVRVLRKSEPGISIQCLLGLRKCSPSYEGGAFSRAFFAGGIAGAGHGVLALLSRADRWKERLRREPVQAIWTGAINW